jgi:hypothetical protein
MLGAQCQSLFRIGAAGLLLVGLFGVQVQLAAGLTPATVLSPSGLATLFAAILPEFLQVLLPVSLAHCLLHLEGTGERSAMAAAGVPPWQIGVVVMAPLLPFLLVLQVLVHQTRPAALAHTRRAVMATEQGVWRGLESVGLGQTRIGDRLHAMVPLGDAVMAVTAAAGGTIETRGATLRAGTVQLVGETDVHRAGFAAARLSFAPIEVGLDQLAVTDLSTGFLVAQSMRWRRARLNWQGVRSGDAIATELGRRRAAVPALSLSLLGVALWLVGRRRLTATCVYGICCPVAVAVSLFLGRVLA